MARTPGPRGLGYATAGRNGCLACGIFGPSARLSETLRGLELCRPASRDAPAAVQSPSVFRSQIGPVAFKIAAACAVVAVVGVAAFNYFAKQQTQAFETPVGGHETLKLADGSRIELNTDTKVRVTLSAGQREVWLDRGEVHFEVQHNAARPFTVVAGNHRVTDLGTKITIRENGNSLRVALLEGRARFETDSLWNQPQTVLLTPGDVVIATKTSLSMERQPSRLLNDRAAII